jgi:hypothetical protein
MSWQLTPGWESDFCTQAIASCRAAWQGAESALISVRQPEAHCSWVLSMAEAHTLTSDSQNDAQALAARSTVVVPPVLGRPPVTGGAPPVAGRPPVVGARPPLPLPPEVMLGPLPPELGGAPPLAGCSKIGSPTERPPHATTQATLSHTALTGLEYAARRA